MSGEIWKPLPDFIKYEISSLGNVRHRVNKCNRKFYKNPLGYWTLNLGKRTIFIHRKLAEAFIPNPDNFGDVNHKDGNKLNNSLNNLEWCTRKYNLNHARENGLHYQVKGSEVGISKLNESQVKSIRGKMLYGTTNKDLAKEYNISDSVISLIRNKKIWKHVK